MLTTHHPNSLNKLPYIMMITSIIDDDEGRHGATIAYPNSPQQDSVTIPLIPPSEYLEFVSSFNGVVCAFHKYFGDLYLSSPLTRMYKKLTLPPSVATITRRIHMIFSMPSGPYSYSASINNPLLSTSHHHS